MSSVAPGRGHPGLSNWLAGLVIGASGGFLVLVFPTLGVALVALGLVGVLRARSRVPGASGLLIGTGATILVILIHAQLACEAFDAVPNQGCEAPDLTAFLAIAGGLLVAGVVLSARAVIDRRASRCGPGQ